MIELSTILEENNRNALLKHIDLSNIGDIPNVEFLTIPQAVTSSEARTTIWTSPKLTSIVPPFIYAIPSISKVPKTSKKLRLVEAPIPAVAVAVAVAEAVKLQTAPEREGQNLANSLATLLKNTEQNLSNIQKEYHANTGLGVKVMDNLVWLTGGNTVQEIYRSQLSTVQTSARNELTRIDTLLVGKTFTPVEWAAIEQSRQLLTKLLTTDLDGLKFWTMTKNSIKAAPTSVVSAGYGALGMAQGGYETITSIPAMVATLVKWLYSLGEYTAKLTFQNEATQADFNKKIQNVATFLKNNPGEQSLAVLGAVGTMIGKEMTRIQSLPSHEQSKEVGKLIGKIEVALGTGRALVNVGGFVRGVGEASIHKSLSIGLTATGKATETVGKVLGGGKWTPKLREGPDFIATLKHGDTVSYATAEGTTGLARVIKWEKTGKITYEGIDGISNGKTVYPTRVSEVGKSTTNTSITNSLEARGITAAARESFTKAVEGAQKLLAQGGVQLEKAYAGSSKILSESMTTLSNGLKGAAGVTLGAMKAAADAIASVMKSLYDGAVQMTWVAKESTMKLLNDIGERMKPMLEKINGMKDGVSEKAWKMKDTAATVVTEKLLEARGITAAARESFTKAVEGAQKLLAQGGVQLEKAYAGSSKILSESMTTLSNGLKGAAGVTLGAMKAAADAIASVMKSLYDGAVQMTWVAKESTMKLLNDIGERMKPMVTTIQNTTQDLKAGGQLLKEDALATVKNGADKTKEFLAKERSLSVELRLKGGFEALKWNPSNIKVLEVTINTLQQVQKDSALIAKLGYTPSTVQEAINTYITTLTTLKKAATPPVAIPLQKVA